MNKRISTAHRINRLTRKERIASISELCLGGKLPSYEDFIIAKKESTNMGKLIVNMGKVEVAKKTDSKAKPVTKVAKKTDSKAKPVTKVAKKITSPINTWGLIDKSSGVVRTYGTRSMARANKTENEVIKKVSIMF